MREALIGLLIAAAATRVLAGSPASAIEDAYADCLKLPPDQQKNALYLWLGDVPPKDVPTLIQLVRYQICAVSTTPDLVQAVLVPPLLLRVDRRDPGPAFDIALQRCADFDPVFHLQVEQAEYTDEPRKVSIGGDGYSKWVRNDAGEWVKPDTVSKTTRVKTSSKKRSVMAQRHIPDCPDCRGWLPDKEAEGLCYLTQSRSPILSAQWLWAHLSRQLSLNNRDEKIGYYDFMGVKSRDDFFQILHIRESDRIRIVRGVVSAGDSGIAQNGRQIENDDGLFGRYWFTLDVNATDGDRNVTEQLKRGDLVHDAEEWYAPGANGLPKYLLSDAKGVIQSTAPDFIGSNGSPGYGGRDMRIHVGLSCMDCHAKSVLLPIDEWARKTFVGPRKLQSPDYQVNKAFQSELFSNLERQRLNSVALFTQSMEEISGMKVDALCTANSAAWKNYAIVPLDAEAVGRMHGCDGKTLIAVMQAQAATVAGVNPALAPLEDAKGTVSRAVAEEQYAVVESYLWSAKP